MKKQYQISYLKGISIHIRITNRDSITHNDDYKTLTKGWEFISENDDEHNSTNENAK